jgi:hypothetical protein
MGTSFKKFIQRKQSDMIQAENLKMASMVVPLPPRRTRISAPEFEEKIDHLRTKKELDLKLKQLEQEKM